MVRKIKISTSSDTNAPTSRASKDDQLEEVASEIGEMIGLYSVKAELNRLISLSSVVKEKKDRNLPVGAFNLHMVFSGPPGTGKTEIARKVGRMLYSLGLLRKQNFVEVSKKDLVGSYTGTTGKIVHEKVKDALDGVLFIDEAYQLAGITGGENDQPDPFGQEAIDTLLKLMEDHRDRLVVIVAGYTSYMRKFIESNAGLKSRFTRTIEFDNYNEDELYGIFQLFVKKGHYILTSDAEYAAKKAISHIASDGEKDESFGNAREIRKFYESVLMCQAQRLGDNVDDLSTLSDEDFLCLEESDIEAVNEE
jgi:stage V sporulation protein K